MIEDRRSASPGVARIVGMRPHRFAVERLPMLVLFGFTIVATVGFGVFGLHPELMIGQPAAQRFYAVSFRFFAQAHVLLGAAVLALYLLRRTRLAWVPSLVAVYVVSLGSELSGTTFGIPFGAYEYSSLLGWKWFERVPALIPLSWFMMALPAYVLARYRFPQSRTPRILLGAAMLTAWDLALDPAMSYLTSYWMWSDPGVYYGMPAVNLLGWFVTSAAIMWMMDALGAARWTRAISIRWGAAFYLITLLMPLGMLVVAAHWGAVIITLAVLAALGVLSARRTTTEPDSDDEGPFRDMPVDLPDPKAYVRARALEVCASNGETADLQRFFAHHSRSFSFAARWFSAEHRRRVAGLYAYCRMTDDLADGDRTATPEVVVRRLQEWTALSRASYFNGASGVPWLDDIMDDSAQAGVPFRLVEDLIRGVQTDADRVRVRTWSELEIYTYRVASVVGIWMCYLFGVRDPETHRRAAALGQAMQLTNILRDVGEDLRHDRIYLPKDVMRRYGVDEDALRKMAAGEEPSASYRALVLEITGRAEAMYTYAEPGLAALPREFGRASAVASEVYRGIHREIRKNGYDNLTRRAVSGPAAKLILASKALIRLQKTRARVAIIHEAAPAARPIPSAARISGALVIVAHLIALSPVAAGATSRSAGDLAATMPQTHVLFEPCPPIGGIREGFRRAVESKEAAAETLTMSRAENCSVPVVQAYEGALLALHAKHERWPPNKLGYLRDGLAILDAVVDLHPGDVEARYLRLLTCYHLPRFFDRRRSVDEDFDVLADLLPDAAATLPNDLHREMVDFVIEHGNPDLEETARLRTVLEGVK